MVFQRPRFGKSAGPLSGPNSPTSRGLGLVASDGVEVVGQSVGDAVGAAQEPVEDQIVNGYHCVI